MPEQTPLAGITIPLWDETDQVPPDMKRSFLEAEKHYVLWATNAADRDAKYGSVSAGTVVTSTELNATWRKNADGSWTTVAYDSGLITSGVVTKGTDTGLRNQWAWERNGFIYLGVGFDWNGSSDIGGGNIANILIGSVAGDWVPPVFAYAVAGLTTGFGWAGITTGGSIYLNATSVPSGQVAVPTGGTIVVNFVYPSKRK